MNQQLVLQDLVIVIAAKNHKTSLLNADFLKCSGIVPSDWELARQPVNASNVAQVMFSNGIAITAEPQRIILAQPIKDIDGESILIPEIARKYARALPNMEFEAVGINPLRIHSFAYRRTRYRTSVHNPKSAISRCMAIRGGRANESIA
ncbi:MAG: hypothetical protein IGS23_11665 [Rivularia sp. T60_A2020_040]|nr:hypothetical protein [Rivularia sp. T60_A2020_040]